MSPHRIALPRLTRLVAVVIGLTTIGIGTACTRLGFVVPLESQDADSGRVTDSASDADLPIGPGSDGGPESADGPHLDAGDAGWPQLVFAALPQSTTVACCTRRDRAGARLNAGVGV